MTKATETDEAIYLILEWMCLIALQLQFISIQELSLTQKS